MMTRLFGNKKSVPPIEDQDNIYTLPADDHPHEGTWLQWPHDFGWDRRHVERYETIWIELTKALHTGERVHIIVYNCSEEERVRNVLRENRVEMSQIELCRYPTDDVWARDNCAIFTFDKEGKLIVENWKFNGWVSLIFDDENRTILYNFLLRKMISLFTLKIAGKEE
jgi:agmatine deiminase